MLPVEYRPGNADHLRQVKMGYVPQDEQKKWSSKRVDDKRGDAGPDVPRVQAEA
jgi:hypothetical protein